MARSRSGISQPSTRCVNAAFVPETNSVQSCWLSSIHLPSSFLRTMTPVAGTGTFIGIEGFIWGLNVAPVFGGGFCPAYGPVVTLTALLKKRRFRNFAPTIVVRLPDSKIAE